MAGRGLNKVMLIGHAGKDTELRFTSSGKPHAQFSLATSESWKDKEGASQEKTTWHNIVAWGRLAEIFNQYVKKGTHIYIEGRIDNRSYDDKDGVKKYISEVVVDEFRFLGGGNRSEGGTSSNGESSYSSAPGAPMTQNSPTPEFDQAIPDSDLPF